MTYRHTRSAFGRRHPGWQRTGTSSSRANRSTIAGHSYRRFVADGPGEVRRVCERRGAARSARAGTEGFTTIICLANRDDLALDQLARAMADTALAASLDASLPDWTETLPADGRNSPTHRALTTPAPDVPTGRLPGRTGASSAPIAGRWSVGRR